MLLNLLQLLQSDDQTTYTDKVNYNFDQILSMGGGPIGPTGFQGIQGVPGAQGLQGFQGPPGMDGTKWYVLPSTNPPSIPTPVLGDLWLQTDTLQVWAYLGSPAMWVNTGNVLASTGVFSNGGANNILFTSPSPLRSLVLSPIVYGIGNDSQGGVYDYKLKVVGTSGSPMIRLGIADTPTVENLPVEQTKLSVQKLIDGNYPSSKNWKFITENLNGDIAFNLSGNYFQIYPQIASVSRFDFGAQTRLQNDAANRIISFSGANTGFELFHIGRHNATANASDRIFSIKDNGQVSFGSSLGDAFTNPTGISTFHIDSLNEDLDTLALSTATINWARFRGRTAIGGGAWDQLNIQHKRLFVDTGGPSQRSAMIKLQHTQGNVDRHFIGFSGGADNSTQVLRPSLRFGYLTAYYMSADLNGRIGMGGNQFIIDHNAVSGGIFQTRLTIEGGTGTYIPTTAPAHHSGIHLAINQTVGGGIDKHVGITAGGLGADTLATFAGIHFQDQSSQPNQGVDMHFGTGLYTSGGETRRRTITRGGDHYWYSKNYQEHFLFMEPGSIDQYYIDLFNIGSYDTTSGQWKSIIFNRGTYTAGLGDGFVGIGATYGEQINGSAPLWPGEWYYAFTNGARTITPFIGFPYSMIVTAGEIFQANPNPMDLDNLDSGSVAKCKPQTKFQVNDAVTFGTRAQNFYASSVGAGSFTIGNNHTASNTRSIILGGSGHTVTGADGIIIGYAGNSIVMPDPNKILLATTTHVSTTAPTPPVSSTLYSSGNTIFIGTPYYRNSSASILNVASSVAIPQFSLIGELGDLARVLTLEGKSSNATLATIPVSMEFMLRNSVGTQRTLGMIAGMYFEPSPGVQRSKLMFAINQNGNLFEYCNISASGIGISAQNFGGKAKLFAESTTDSASPGGHTMSVLAGSALAGFGAAGGGNLAIDAGAGASGGANGQVLIGTHPLQPASRIMLGGPVTETSSATGVIRANGDFTTGTDTQGFIVTALNTLSAPTLILDSQGSVGYNTAISFFTTKRLGKTMILHFRIKAIDYINSTGETWYIRLPGFAQPATAHNNVSATIQERFEVGTAFFRHNLSAEYDKIGQVFLRRDNSGGASFGTGTWFLQIVAGYRRNTSPLPNTPDGTLSKYYADAAQNNSDWFGTITFGLD